MILYIAGKVSGEPGYKEKFDKADMQLSAAGYDVENPTEHGLENATWVGAMRWLIPRLLSCDGVAMLPNWRKSRGARLEVYIAKKLGMPCKPVQYWLKRAK